MSFVGFAVCHCFVIFRSAFVVFGVVFFRSLFLVCARPSKTPGRPKGTHDGPMICIPRASHKMAREVENDVQNDKQMTRGLGINKETAQRQKQNRQMTNEMTEE